MGHLRRSKRKASGLESLSYRFGSVLGGETPRSKRDFSLRGLRLPTADAVGMTRFLEWRLGPVEGTGLKTRHYLCGGGTKVVEKLGERGMMAEMGVVYGDGCCTD